MVQANLLALIDSLYDLSSHLIGEFALSSARPELSPVDVGVVKGSWSRDTFSLHVSCGVFPHDVEPRSIGTQGGIGKALCLSKLSSGD